MISRIGLMPNENGGECECPAMTINGLRNIAGLTAVEMLLVVLILSVVTAMTVPSFRQTYGRFRLRKTAEDLAYVMRYAQSRAIAKNRPMRLELNADLTSYFLAQKTEGDASAEDFERFSGRIGRNFQIPEDIKVQTEGSYVFFWPDGNIDRQSLEVCRDTQCLTVSTKEQRGYVRIIEQQTQ